jgi:hypothetical protein
MPKLTARLGPSNDVADGRSVNEPRHHVLSPQQEKRVAFDVEAVHGIQHEQEIILLPRQRLVEARHPDAGQCSEANRPTIGREGPRQSVAARRTRSRDWSRARTGAKDGAIPQWVSRHVNSARTIANRLPRDVAHHRHREGPHNQT